MSHTKTELMAITKFTVQFSLPGLALAGPAWRHAVRLHPQLSTDVQDAAGLRTGHAGARDRARFAGAPPR